jgi:hypothetical protein
LSFAGFILPEYRRKAFRDMDEYDWGYAEVGFPDWKGTAQLDEKMTGPDSIYDYTGVDENEFQIIGFSFGGGESGVHDLHVIAVRKAELDGQHIADVDTLRAVDIQVHDVDPWEVLQKMTHYLDVRFRLRAVENATITITELLDSPPQT